MRCTYVDLYLCIYDHFHTKQCMNFMMFMYFYAFFHLGSPITFLYGYFSIYEDTLFLHDFFAFWRNFLTLKYIEIIFLFFYIFLVFL